MKELSDPDYQLLAALLANELPLTSKAPALRLLEENTTARDLYTRLATQHSPEVPISLDLAWSRLQNQIKLSFTE